MISESIRLRESLANALPEPSRFVGRAREIGEISRLIASERLVTILGPGGMGKTRIAREAAHAHDDARTHDAAALFCDLTRASTLPEARAVIAGVLGIDLSGADPDAQIAAAARARSSGARGALLLVLDNLEQLADAIGELALRILAVAPEVRLLGTSRIALRCPGEAIYELGPLSLPEDPARLEESDAFALWVDRVTRMRSTYVPANEDPAVISALLRAIDGNPLAIELLATHARSLPAPALQRLLGDRFALLRAGDRTWEERHRTLASVIGTSWDALDDAEQNALAALTVFAGTFSAEAALAVLGDDASSSGLRPDTPGADFLGSEDRASSVLLLDSLRDKSLLASRGERLHLYESIRAFVIEQKRDFSGARARHAAFFADLAGRLSQRETRSAADREAKRAVVEEERANLSAVAFGESSEHAIVCLAALDVLHPVRDPGPEFLVAVERHAQRVLADDTARPALAHALALSGYAARRASDFTTAHATLSRALDLAEKLELEVLAWDVRAERAMVAKLLGRSEEEIEAELALLIAYAPLAANGRACAIRALMRQDRGELAEARAWNERALVGLEAAAPAELAYALLCLFEIQIDEGDAPAAAATLARVEAIRDHLGDPRLRAYVANMRAWSLVESDPARAAALYEEALRAAPKDPPLHGILLGWQGVAWFSAGKYGESLVALERALGVVKAKMQRAILEATRTAARALLRSTTLAEAEAELEAIAKVTPTDAAWVVTLRALLRVELEGGAALADALRAAERAAKGPASGVLGRLGSGILGRAIVARGDLPNAIVVAKDGTSFARGGATAVSLATQELPARVLAALADAHARDSRGLAIAAIFELAWPGERASPSSVEERVRAVIKRLRRAGLDDLLVAHEGGFRFAPGTRMERS